MITVNDDYLPKEAHNVILTHFTESKISWHYEESVNGRPGEEDNLNNYQLVHDFFHAQKVDNPSKETTWLMPLLACMPIYYLLRLKMNLNPRCPEQWVSDFHTDTRDLNNLTSIYYLNTNNGATVFETGDKVDSIANRLVTFPSHMKHAAMMCTDTKARFVLNINYFPTKDGSKTQGVSPLSPVVLNDPALKF